jgi:hypothetical protein
MSIFVIRRPVKSRLWTGPIPRIQQWFRFVCKKRKEVGFYVADIHVIRAKSFEQAEDILCKHYRLKKGSRSAQNYISRDGMFAVLDDSPENFDWFSYVGKIGYDRARLC